MKGSTEQHSDLVNQILISIGMLPFVRVWKNATGAYQDDRGLWVRYGLPGSADITGVLNHSSGVGLRLEIECKTGNAVQSKIQKNFQTMIINMGGLYLLARDAQSSVEFVHKAREYDLRSIRQLCTVR